MVKPPRFNAYYDIEDVKPVNGATWKLELAGRIDDKRPWTAQQLYALPEQEIIIRHICVEGWDYIGQWSGVNLKSFLQRVGADLTAKYVYFHCADDYTESIDMAAALHPQTILATRYANETIADPFGFPLRLRTATKLGYKNAKWIKAIEVSNNFHRDVLEQAGFQLVRGDLVFSPSAGSLAASSRHFRFSNRPFGVKRFQTIRRCSVDVAHGLVLLFGIGTKALPAWDSRTRWNNRSTSRTRAAGSKDCPCSAYCDLC